MRGGCAGDQGAAEKGKGGGKHTRAPGVPTGTAAKGVGARKGTDSGPLALAGDPWATARTAATAKGKGKDTRTAEVLAGPAPKGAGASTAAKGTGTGQQSPPLEVEVRRRWGETRPAGDRSAQEPQSSALQVEASTGQQREWWGQWEPQQQWHQQQQWEPCEQQQSTHREQAAQREQSAQWEQPAQWEQWEQWDQWRGRAAGQWGESSASGSSALWQSAQWSSGQWEQPQWEQSPQWGEAPQRGQSAQQGQSAQRAQEQHPAQPASSSSAAVRPLQEEQQLAPAAASAPADAPAASEMELQEPDVHFGNRGDPIQLLANHCLLKVSATGASAVWKTWQVDFEVPTQVPEVPAQAGKGKGAGKGAGKASAGPSEPPRPVRRAAVAKALERCPGDLDWLYDGYHCLWSCSTVGESLEMNCQVELQSRGEIRRKWVLTVRISKATDQSGQQQELDLRWLDNLPRCKDPLVELAQHRRFVQVALRNFASSSQELLPHGRRVLCPNARHLLDEKTEHLRHGRELWWGFIAQVELADGVLLPGSPARQPRCTLSLNLVASVGVPEVEALEFLARMLAESQRHSRWSLEDSAQYYREELKWRWPPDLNERLLKVLDGDTGLRGLRVATTYMGYEKKANVVGITHQPADRLYFDCEGLGGGVSVADYFERHRGIKLKYPFLPCLQLGNAKTWVPLEFVKVLGGEHNLSVGRLHPDFQQTVTKLTAMPPGNRLAKIEKLFKHDSGPRIPLQNKGITFQTRLLNVTGRILPEPEIVDSSRRRMRLNNYSDVFEAIQPPDFGVRWALWSLSARQSELGDFAETLYKVARKHRMNFRRVETCSYPEQSWGKLSGGRTDGLEEALRQDLRQLPDGLQLLVVLLPEKELWAGTFRAHLKIQTECEQYKTMATQFLIYDKKVNMKLDKLILKLGAKLPLREDGTGVARQVELAHPNKLLSSRTMVMGADVTHNAAGVSVAGVVATRDEHHVNYFSELRGQSSFDLNSTKVRRRKSEERIVDLQAMARELLLRWHKENGELPKTVLYYRDGVSDGQFVEVLKHERNLLAKAFEEAGRTCGVSHYNPPLVVFVGQKRHQTRLFKADDGGKCHSKGKGKGNDGRQVPPGTVVSEGLAQPGRINFFLVAQQGIQGTSVPCHYHLLHCDKRLVDEGVNVNDLERVTYDLCALYSRADKTVSYAAPAYLADHLCERGKDYLETKFGTSLSAEQDEERIKREIEERVDWLNNQSKGLGGVLQGRNFFC